MKEWITNVITRELKALRREIEAYPSDDGMWEVLPGIANPGGNLALHLAGNIQYFLGNVLGKSGYVRNRDAEFASRDVPRNELLREIDNAIAAVEAGMGKIAESDLARPFPEAVGGVSSTTGAFRAFRDAPRLSPRPGGLPSPHPDGRKQDREGDGADGAGRKAGMTTRTVGRPEADEIPAHFVGYIQRVSELDPVTVCAAQIEETASVLHGLSDDAAMYRYARGKWSVKEVVGHLADVERIMAYRALRIARGDETPLPGFDENAYVPIAKFDARSLADLVGELRTTRAATLALLRTFDTDAWRRRGTASGKPVSVRALAFIIPGHERHHLDILRTRYGVGEKQ